VVRLPRIAVCVWSSGAHSGGSILAIGVAGTYPGDADGPLITGFIHNVNTEAVGRFFQSLHPAASDPAFAQAQPRTTRVT
jgi:hypothetical protein